MIKTNLTESKYLICVFRVDPSTRMVTLMALAGPFLISPMHLLSGILGNLRVSKYSQCPSISLCFPGDPSIKMTALAFDYLGHFYAAWGI